MLGDVVTEGTGARSSRRHLSVDEFDFGATLQTGSLKKSQKKRKIKHKSLKSNSSTDDILNQIASRSSLRHPFSPADIEVKALTLPFMDAFYQIRENSRADDELDMVHTSHGMRPGSSQFWNVDPGFSSSTAESPSLGQNVPHDPQHVGKKGHRVSADYLRKRYSRLFSCFRLHEFDLSSVRPRSDRWMARFMEDCYDDAMVACNKSMGRDRKINNRLDLGEMDFFPLTMYRFLSRTYSVLAVRTKICLEMLVSLEAIVASGESISSTFGLTDPAGLYDSNPIDSCRSVIFSRLLSEEYDSNFLAIFLHCRAVAQRTLRIDMTEMNQPLQWVLPSIVLPSILPPVILPSVLPAIVSPPVMLPSVMSPSGATERDCRRHDRNGDKNSDRNDNKNDDRINSIPPALGRGGGRSPAVLKGVIKEMGTIKRADSSSEKLSSLSSPRNILFEGEGDDDIDPRDGFDVGSQESYSKGEYSKGEFSNAEYSKGEYSKGEYSLLGSRSMEANRGDRGAKAPRIAPHVPRNRASPLPSYCPPSSSHPSHPPSHPLTSSHPPEDEKKRKKAKAVPYPLPPCVHYITDFTLPEASAVAFDVTLLPLLCSSLLYNFEEDVSSISVTVDDDTRKERSYFGERVLRTTRELKENGEKWKKYIDNNNPSEERRERKRSKKALRPVGLKVGVKGVPMVIDDGSNNNSNNSNSNNDSNIDNNNHNFNVPAIVSPDPYGGGLGGGVQSLRNIEDKMLPSLREMEAAEGEALLCGALSLPSGLKVIPVYALLLCLLEEWKAAPDTVRAPNSGHEQDCSSLKALNAIYSSDCLLSRGNESDIKAIEGDLNSCQSRMIKVAKAVRQLEGLYSDGLASPLELEELVGLRVQVQEVKNERASLKSKLSYYLNKKKLFDDKTEQLWADLSPSFSKGKNGGKGGKGGKDKGGRKDRGLENRLLATMSSRSMKSLTGLRDKERDDVMDTARNNQLGEEQLRSSTAGELSTAVRNTRGSVLGNGPGNILINSSEPEMTDMMEMTEDGSQVTGKGSEKRDDRKDETRDERRTVPAISTPLWRAMTSDMIRKTISHHERKKRAADAARREALKAALLATKAVSDRERLRREVEEKENDSRLFLQRELKRAHTAESLRKEILRGEQIREAASHAVEGIMDCAVLDVGDSICVRYEEEEELILCVVMDIVTGGQVEAMYGEAVAYVTQEERKRRDMIEMEALKAIIDREDEEKERVRLIEVEVREREEREEEEVRMRLFEEREREIKEREEEEILSLSIAESKRKKRLLIFAGIIDVLATAVSTVTERTIESEKQTALILKNILRSESAVCIQRMVRSHQERKSIESQRVRERESIEKGSEHCIARGMRRRGRFFTHWRGYTGERGRTRAILTKRHMTYFKMWERAASESKDRKRGQQGKGQGRRPVSDLRKSMVSSQLLDTHHTEKIYQASKKVRIWMEQKVRQMRHKDRTAQIRISRHIRRYLAVRKVREIRRKSALQHENILSLTDRRTFALQKMYFAPWYRGFLVLKGVNTMGSAVNRALKRRALHTWVHATLTSMFLENKSAVILQSAWRMYMVKKYVLHYHRWRRGISRFQAIVRRRGVLPRYRHLLFIYGSAREIQRVTRGHLVRIDLTNRRITDICYSAERNNYHRLLYYTVRYPFLVWEVDGRGDSALHYAARGAAKRTLKLLVKFGLQRTLLNDEGYAPIHSIIVTSAPLRDECCTYMIDRGFDENQLTGDGRSCLLLAVEHNRPLIAKELLRLGLDPNATDSTGTTCLQHACYNGSEGLVAQLIDHKADVNMAGYLGLSPLHSSVSREVEYAEITRLLLSNGAIVSTAEPYGGRTACMMAAKGGYYESLKLLIVWGADLYAVDLTGRCIQHHAVHSDSAAIHSLLQSNILDLDKRDMQGCTPLHLAVLNNSLEYAKALLEGGVDASPQNNNADQPSHLAAKENKLPMLQLLCRYDEHIGRLNYDHQSPIGIARMYGATDTQLFLERHYRKVDIDILGNPLERNRVGDLWWEKDFEVVVDEWGVRTDMGGDRLFVSHYTGETKAAPPSLSAKQIYTASKGIEIPLRRIVNITNEEQTLNAHNYAKEFKLMKGDIDRMAVERLSAILIQKNMRRHTQLLLLGNRKFIHSKRQVIRNFILSRIQNYELWKFQKRCRGLVKIQKTYRGWHMRKYFVSSGEYERMRERKDKSNLSRLLSKAWASYKSIKKWRVLLCMARAPKTNAGWRMLVSELREPHREVGFIAEYIYPRSVKVYFYCHTITGDCSFEKPKLLQIHDRREDRESEEIRRTGYKDSQVHLALVVQALWAQYSQRKKHAFIDSITQLSKTAERTYLLAPQKDDNVYNFALCCFSVLQDMDRARALFIESMERMERRGPDNPYVLYSYAIYCSSVHELDNADIVILLERAREAERAADDLKVAKHRREVEERRKSRRRRGSEEAEYDSYGKAAFRYGRSYERARVGFYQHGTETLNNAVAWHQYALCMHLVFNDFHGSFEAFLYALKYDTESLKVRANFDAMMTHFHGEDRDRVKQVTDQRVLYIAQKERDAHDASEKRKGQQKISLKAIVRLARSKDYKGVF